MRRSHMRRSSLVARAVLGVILVAALSFIALPQTPPPAAGAFTAAQASSGRAIYTQNCAACHGMDLEGSGDAPALAGGTFLLKWRSMMVSELFGEILQTMP